LISLPVYFSSKIIFHESGPIGQVCKIANEFNRTGFYTASKLFCINRVLFWSVSRTVVWCHQKPAFNSGG